MICGACIDEDRRNSGRYAQGTKRRGMSYVTDMKTSVMIASVLLTGTAMAADSLQDCTITAVRERVLAEQSGGPQRATEEGEALSPARSPAVFEVAIACGQKKYFAVFTAGSKFNRTGFDTRRAVRVSIKDGKIQIENGEGAQATGRVTAER